MTTTTPRTAEAPSEPPRRSSWAGRARRVDPLVPLTCATALAVYLVLGFDGYLTRDIGLYSYAGQQLADGVPPYVAVLNRAGPLAHLIPGLGALAAKGLGAEELLGMRVLMLLISVAGIGVAYLLGRDLLRSRTAGLASAAALLSFQGVAVYAAYGPREKTPLLLFLLLALLATVHQRWATAGLMVSLATLTWQPAFGSAAAGLLVAVLVAAGPGKVRALVRIAAAGLVPPALFVVVYAVLGHLQLFLDDFVLINLRYTDQISYLGDLGKLHGALDEGFGWSMWVFVAGAVAVLVGTVTALLQRSTRRDSRTAVLAGTCATLVVGVLWSTKAFNGWADLFFLLPVACVGVAWLAAEVARRLSVRVAVGATLVWSLLVVALTLGHVISIRNHDLDVQRRDVAAVLSVLPTGDRQILSDAAPQPLVLAHQRNPTRVQLFGNGVVDYLDDTWPGGHRGFADWIVQRRPAVVAYGVEGVWAYEFTRPSIDASYTCVGSTPGWRWFVRNDLGTPTIRAAAAALPDHSCPEGAPRPD